MSKQQPPDRPTPPDAGEERTPFASHFQAERHEEQPLVRVMGLHALAYCERLFHLEEVEEIRLADEKVVSGRRLHETIDPGPKTWRMEMASESLGLRGAADCMRREDGGLVVVEHKKGRSNKGEAWSADRLQVLAYALLASEHAGETVAEAKLRYHADNVTVTFPVDAVEAGREVGEAVRRARELSEGLARPPVDVPEGKCRHCSLAPACLPEEDRFLARAKTPLRLFPPTAERRVIHVTEQGAGLSRDGDRIVCRSPDGSEKSIPGRDVEGLVLHGNVQITAQCLAYCAAHDVDVHWLSYGGAYIGALSPGAGQVKRRHRQYEALSDPQVRFRLASGLIQAKIANQLGYLGRSSRTSPERKTRLGAHLHDLALALKRARQRADQQDTPERAVNHLRGDEALAAQAYFRGLAALISPREGELLHFAGRTRRPPKDPFNALLSFGYALLYRDCVAGLLASGLEPAFGFMHTPRSAAYPLAMDIMDLFRSLLWDIPLIGSVNRNHWVREDFDITREKVWLSDQGRRKAITTYEARKAETWKHPVLKYSLTYGRTIELEARLLEKEWTGSPGLFAQLRLR